MKIQDLRKIGREILIKNNVEDTVFKVDMLLRFVTNMSKAELLINLNKELNIATEEVFLTYINDISEGKPIQYITNKQEFMKINFYVNENVLIPQPDTEILVENAIERIQKFEKETIDVLDLCTGSGAIAVSIKKYTEKVGKKVNVCASDISKKALEIAERNAKENGVNIEFILSDLFARIKKTFDIIVSNPPYIASSVIGSLSKEVQSEPHLALDGGMDGLEFYRNIAKDGYKYLNVGGCLMLEIGYDQKNQVMDLFKSTKMYGKIDYMKDLSGNDRMIIVDGKRKKLNVKY